MAEAETQPANNLIKQVRDSETGKSLTASQFGEAWSIAGIMHHTIRKTGKFKQKLTGYARAFADPEQIDALHGEATIRDIFAERYGEDMNVMRERLQHNQENLPEHARPQALEVAKTIEPMIKQGETMPFYQAYDRAGRQLAKSLDITESGAKELMKDTYREATGRSLYDDCKTAEKAHYRAFYSEEQSQGRGQNRAPTGGKRRSPRRAQG